MSRESLVAGIVLAFLGFGASAEPGEAPSFPPAVDLSANVQRPATGEWLEASGRCDFPHADPDPPVDYSLYRTPGADPAETARHVTAHEPTDLWQRIRTGFAMKPLASALVAKHEEWYRNRPGYLQQVVERSRRYLYFIVEEVERRGMPTEIALLPIVESAYNPTAYSRAHASGLWQFIPSTGRKYGLKDDFWYDGRRDVIAATGAALDYLQDLYGMFNDWELALAAYNWGEGAVGRAILRNEARGLSTDYLSLPMPSETRNYLPRLMAVKNVIADPAAHGVDLEAVPNEPYFVAVATSMRIDASLAARLAESSLEEFTSLNPAHTRPVVSASENRPLLLPRHKLAAFERNLEKHDAPLVTWQTHTLKRGERLDKVAAKYRISLAELKEVNGIMGRMRVRPGDTLVVPARNAGSVRQASAPTGKLALNVTLRRASAAASHRVHEGDTLFNIGRRYGVSVEDLRHWNRIDSSHLTIGQELRLSPDPGRLARGG